MKQNYPGHHILKRKKRKFIRSFGSLDLFIDEVGDYGLIVGAGAGEWGWALLPSQVRWDHGTNVDIDHIRETYFPPIKYPEELIEYLQAIANLTS